MIVRVENYGAVATVGGQSPPGSIKIILTLGIVPLDNEVPVVVLEIELWGRIQIVNHMTAVIEVFGEQVVWFIEVGIWEVAPGRGVLNVGSIFAHLRLGDRSRVVIVSLDVVSALGVSSDGQGLVGSLHLCFPSFVEVRWMVSETINVGIHAFVREEVTVVLVISH